MAIVNAANTGNWSNSATWPGGVFPTASDDVYANGKTVTIDQAVTVLSLNTTAAGGGVTGGGFTVGASVAIVAVINAGTTACLTQSSAYSSPLVGNVNGGVLGNVPGIILSAGTMTVTGTSTGGNGGTSARGVSVTLGAVLVLTGTSIGAPAAATAGIAAGGNAASSVSVTGTVAGSATNTGAGLQMTGGTVLVTGSVAGSATANGMSMATGGVSVIVVGTVTGGSGVSIYGISRAVAVPLTVDTVVSGAGFGAAGINNTVADAQVYVKALNFGTADQTPVIGAVRFVQASGYYITGKRSDGVTPAVYIDEQLDADVPVITNVRSGVSYAHGALTGTCAVPPAASVATGVPIDNTTGTSIISMSDPAMLQLLQDVADIETAMGSISVDLTPVTDALTLMDGKIDVIDGNVDDIETAVGSISVDLTPVTDALTAIDGKVDIIDTNVDDIETAVYDLTHVDGDPVVRIIPPPETPLTCRVYEYAYTQDGSEPLATAHTTAKIINVPFDYNGVLHDGSVVEASTTTPDESGNYAIYWDLPYTAAAVIILTEHGVRHQITVPALSTARVSDLIAEEE